MIISVASEEEIANREIDCKQSLFRSKVCGEESRTSERASALIVVFGFAFDALTITTAYFCYVLLCVLSN